MMNTNLEIKAKGILAVITGVTSYLLNCFTELVVVLALLMLFDYATGVIGAYFKKELSSWKGLQGILKKFSFMLLVVLGFLIDFVVSYLIEKVGLQFTTNGFFGLATTCWLIGNEGLSILENLAVIGLPMPPFLKPALTKLKDTADSIGGGKDEE